MGNFQQWLPVLTWLGSIGFILHLEFSNICTVQPFQYHPNLFQDLRKYALDFCKSDNLAHFASFQIFSPRDKWIELCPAFSPHPPIPPNPQP